jgi:hypothetical protein
MDGAAPGGGDLLRGQLLTVEHRDELPLPIRERLDAGLERLLAGIGLVGKADRHVGQLRKHRLAEHEPVAAAGTPMMQDLVPRHPESPGDKRLPFTKRVESPPERQTRRLKDVVGRGAIVYERADVGQHLRLPAGKMPEKRLVTPLICHDDCPPPIGQDKT